MSGLPVKEVQLPVFDNAGNGDLHVPGFSAIPVDQELDSGDFYMIPDAFRFCHGYNFWKFDRLTVRELAMIRLMDAITDKPQWNEKINDENIVSKWHDEATAMPLISEKAWTWCLDELRDRAKAFEKVGHVLTLEAGSRCAKSDTNVSQDLRAELIRNVESLFSIPDHEKDWHPGSDGKVLNLVHPSLFPLVYGTTRVLSSGGRVELSDIYASYGKGDVSLEPATLSQGGPHVDRGWHRRTRNLLNETWSKRFQWLPCEVEFHGKTGTEVRITSYINNLNPVQHQPLYKTVEKLIALAIPLWNDVLGKAHYPRNFLRIAANRADFQPSQPSQAMYYRARDLPKSLSDPKYSETMAQLKTYLEQPDNPESIPDEDDDDMDQPGDILARVEEELQQIDSNPNSGPQAFPWTIVRAFERKWKRIRRVVHPEPGEEGSYQAWKQKHTWPTPDDPYQRTGYYEVNLQDEFRDQGLQVIVKLSSIELTPEQPTYSGGNWHLEGMLNEHIVATAIYYYDVENVTPSRLSVRQEATLDQDNLEYEQSEHEPLATIFGTENPMTDVPAVQDIGSITTRQGRMLVFPNTLQHRVSSFELQDKTKPGHRRFVVLWLVDPHYRICSTRNVPPQQHDWWVEEGIEKIQLAKKLGFPPEILDMVKDKLDQWPMGLDQAKMLRLELMGERTRMSMAVEENFEMYDLCEH
jgi:hypothetical protein